MLNIFNDDAFSLTSLTAAINRIEHIPSRAGELAFAGVGEGVSSLTVAIEEIGGELSLIQTSRRNEPAPKEIQDKSTLRALSIPQIKLEDSIGVGMVQGVRAFGTENEVTGLEAVIAQQLKKMTQRHDLTLEHHRMGALQGLILDADGSELLDLYAAFGVAQDPVLDFSEIALTDSDTAFPSARTIGHVILRRMQRHAKLAWPGAAKIWCFCGDNFFDRVIESSRVLRIYEGSALAEQKLGANYANGVFYFGGVYYENYRGTDDGTTVNIGPDDAIFFPIGIPGLYAEYFAPADFLETVNTIGLPRYARAAPDNRFNRIIELHTQQNPLPLCLRPQVLQRGTITPGGTETASEVVTETAS